MNPRTFVSTAAAIALTGAVLSGPVGIAIVALTHPQPPWNGPASFAASYHSIQALPYFMGMLLAGGFVALIAGLHRVAPESARVRTTVALVLSGAFAAMIFTNYAIQTTVVPALVTSGPTENASLIAIFTMANPRSLGWSLEMWGYAVLGVATWFAAPAFGASHLERTSAVLFAVNGPMSIAGAFATALWPGWVLSAVGLVSFAVWNVLIIVMLASTILCMRTAPRGEAA
jgi:hypothetical protein